MLGARPSDTVVQITSRHNGPDLGETVMRKIAAGLFITLDGIADGEEKWVGPYHSPEFDETIQSLMAAGDTLLLGRVTYEFFAAAFGGQAGPHADYLNSVPKVVVSSTLDRADWQNTTLISENVAEEITKLKQRPGKKINMSGSITLVQWLLRAGLLDELHLIVFPVAVGTGRRLFEDVPDQVAFELKSHRPLPNGVLHLTYEVA
jgi:dihydrofolate reductase